MSYTYIQTYTGRLFDIQNIDDLEVDIEDIAQGLSNICRFTGHCKNFYSVAEHSVLASHLGIDSLQALLHDASEAYLGDIPRPVKPLIPRYKEKETQLQKKIFETFKVPFPLSQDTKEVDTRLLKTEALLLMDYSDYIWQMQEIEEYHGIVFNLYNPEQAKRAFMARFRELY